MDNLFSPGNLMPHEQPAWIDGACSDAHLRGRIATRLTFAQQAPPDSHERLACLREAARLEAILDARERNRS